MKKILIIGPIEDYGGRELEAGFIASSLNKHYRVEICSTGIITNKSQVLTFDKNLIIFSINELLIRKYRSLKIVAFLIHLKNRAKKSYINSVNNFISKNYLNYHKKTDSIIDNLVGNYDAIFIVAQLSSNHIQAIVDKSTEHNIKIIFRTTGTIRTDKIYRFVNNVNLFIHHSKANASLLNLENHNYEIVDQCAFNEEELLQIPVLANKVKVFLALGRLEREKNFHLLIEAFLSVKKEGDLLYIVGCGSQLLNLEQLANNEESVIFAGHIPNNHLKHYFKLIDCLMICSNEEAGPLVGIEAMASGRLIISTKVGAMPERTDSTDFFWIEPSVKSISKMIEEVKGIDIISVKRKSTEIRQNYISNFSNNIISDKYLKLTDNLLSECE